MVPFARYRHGKWQRLPLVSTPLRRLAVDLPRPPALAVPENVGTPGRRGRLSAGLCETIQCRYGTPYDVKGYFYPRAFRSRRWCLAARCSRVPSGTLTAALRALNLLGLAFAFWVATAWLPVSIPRRWLTAAVLLCSVTGRPCRAWTWATCLVFYRRFDPRSPPGVAVAPLARRRVAWHQRRAQTDRGGGDPDPRRSTDRGDRRDVGAADTCWRRPWRQTAATAVAACRSRACARCWARRWSNWPTREASRSNVCSRSWVSTSLRVDADPGGD